MSSIEALKRIKRKYKYLIVKEIHRSTRNSNINFGNVEEYWHKENNDDFSQIKKDLEILYMLKKNMKVESEPLKTFNNRIIKYEYIAYNDRELNIKTEEEYNKIREWLLK